MINREAEARIAKAARLIAHQIEEDYGFSDAYDGALEFLRHEWPRTFSDLPRAALLVMHSMHRKAECRRCHIIIRPHGDHLCGSCGLAV